MRFALSIMAGCGSQIGEEEELACVEVGRSPLALDVPSPDGVVARDVVDRIVSPFHAAFEWYHLGTGTRVEVSVVHTGDGAELVTFEDRGRSGARLEQPGPCDRRVVTTVETSVATDDGQLDERWTAELWIFPDESTHQVLDLTDPAGSFVAADHAPPDRDFASFPSAAVKVGFDATGRRGSGGVQVEGDGGADGTPGEVVDGEEFWVGTWPVVEEE